MTRFCTYIHYIIRQGKTKQHICIKTRFSVITFQAVECVSTTPRKYSRTGYYLVTFILRTIFLQVSLLYVQEKQHSSLVLSKASDSFLSPLYTTGHYLCACFSGPTIHLQGVSSQILILLCFASLCLVVSLRSNWFLSSCIFNPNLSWFINVQIYEFGKWNLAKAVEVNKLCI